MPYHIEWKPKGYWKKLNGMVSAGEFLQSISEIQQDPRFDELRYGINDCLAVEDVVINASDIEMFAALGIGASYSNPHLKIAMLVTHPKVKAMVESYAKMTTYPIAFFETRTDVEQWIDANAASVLK
jgi:hypothetical protein